MQDGNNGGKTNGAETPVADVLLTVSHEVRNLSNEASDLQNLIGNLVVAGAFGGSQSIYELQSLDKLCQSLGAIADFVNGLANHSSSDWKIDLKGAAETVKLADVRDRLTGQSSERPESTGEFEDFNAWPLTA